MTSGNRGYPAADDAAAEPSTNGFYVSLGCPSGKRRIAREASARFYLDKIARQVGRREKRAYRCPECRGWHLTSMESAR